MIYIGEQDKTAIINKYLSENKINKIITIGEQTGFGECIKFADTIMYKYFYRLLQEIDGETLIILNECLKKRNRYDLTYNCIRRYVLQTKHRLIFNYYPIIKEPQDFMIIYDMIQDNPFLKEKYEYITKFKDVIVGKIDFDVEKMDVLLSDAEIEAYKREKEKIIGQVEKDPDIIPRRLLKFSEKLNKKHVKVFDSMKSIKQKMTVAVNQTGVDQYYYGELLNFKKGIENAVENILG